MKKIFEAPNIRMIDLVGTDILAMSDNVQNSTHDQIGYDEDAAPVRGIFDSVY